MLSMEPSIKRGLTFWDQALMPADEFGERIALIRGEMRKMALDALILSGNMYEDADLIYVVGGNVDGTLVLTDEEDPIIFTNSGSREIFFLKQLTWINRLSHVGPLVGKAVRTELDRMKNAPRRIGTAELQVLTAAVHRDLQDALAGLEVIDFSQHLCDIRSKARPREVIAVRRALGIAEQAASAAAQAFGSGASNSAALVEAERIARLAGAWDFRALANLNGDELRPYERPSSDRRTSLLLWLATRYQGYWADRVVSVPAQSNSEAAGAIAAMCAAARSGSLVREVAQAGLSRLPADAQQSALAYGLGQGIGASLDHLPRICPTSDDRLADGALLSLRVFARSNHEASFSSTMVQVCKEATHVLRPL